MKVLHLIVLFLFLIPNFGCNKSPSTGDSDGTQDEWAPPKEKLVWKHYSNAFIEFDYPSNWLLTPPKADENPFEASILLTHPDFKDDPPGPLDVYINNSPTFPHTKILREVVRDRMIRTKKEGWKLTKEPESILLGAGRCYFWMREKQTNHLCEQPDGRQGPCFDTWLTSECRTDTERRIAIVQHLYPHALPGRLDEKYGAKQKEVYERLLRSIKFKKPRST